MSGAADFDRAPSVERLRAAMQALARFHLAVADLDFTGYTVIRSNLPMPGAANISPAIMRRAVRLARVLLDRSPTYNRAIAESDWIELTPLAREFLSVRSKAIRRTLTLFEPVAQATLPLQVCIRDIWHDHVLFTGDEVTGLVDFGALDVDTPAGDVARLLGSLVGDDRERWQIGVDAYSEVRPLSADERAALPGLDASAIVIALTNWVRWIYIEGRQFENREQVVVRFAGLLNRMRSL
jgi:homoserine kinase type II